MERTNLRSSPEDADFFKKFHDRAWSLVRAGMAADKAVAKLMTLGVPEESARRIVRAVEQEISLTKPAPVPSWNPIWLAVGLGVALCTIWVFYSSITTRSTGPNPKTFVKAAALLVVIGILVMGLLRGSSKKPGK